MIGVIDLGRGNIGSVFNALKFLGESPCVLDSPRRINDCKKIILPGVGSFFSSMTELKMAWAAMEGKAGAVVALDPRDGPCWRGCAP